MFIALEWWREGGFWMFPILGIAVMTLSLSIVTVPLSISAYFAPVMKRVTQVGAGLVLLLALLPTGLGFVGWLQGKHTTDEALQHVEEADIREEIRVRGYSEASHPLDLGVMSSLCVGLPALLALALAVLAPGG